MRVLTLSYFDGGSCGVPEVVELSLSRDAGCGSACSVHVAGGWNRYDIIDGGCVRTSRTLDLDLTFSDGGVTGSGTSQLLHNRCSGQVAVIDAGP